MDNKIGRLASKKITLLGYVCAILVMLIHSSGYKYFQISEISIGSTFIVNFIDILTDDLPQVSVSMFFVISGFLFFNNVSEIEKDTCNKFFKEKYVKRIKTLLIPYILWNTIWMVFIILITYIPAISSKIDSLKLFEPSIINVFKGIFLFEYSGICWYIFFLMIYALLSPLIYYCMRKKYSGIVLLIGSFIICGFTYNNEYLNYLNLFNSLFFYCLGVYLALHHYSFINKEFGNKEITLGLLGCIIAVTYFQILHVSEFIDEAVRVLFICSLWVFMDIFKDVKMKWWLEISFFIYVFHGMTQQCINKIICAVLPNYGKMSALYALINTIGGVLITLALSTILSYILLKYFGNIWNYIAGYRVPKLFNKKEQ